MFNKIKQFGQLFFVKKHYEWNIIGYSDWGCEKRESSSFYYILTLNNTYKINGNFDVFYITFNS